MILLRVTDYDFDNENFETNLQNNGQPSSEKDIQTDSDICINNINCPSFNFKPYPDLRDFPEIS